VSAVKFHRWDVLRFMIDPRFRRDPYPLYDLLRAVAPVHNAMVAATTLAEYETVMNALRDPRLSSDVGNADFRYSAGRLGAGLVAEAPFRFMMRRGGAGTDPAGPFVIMERRFLTGIDAPDHTRLRGLVSRAFTPRVVAEATPIIEKIAQEVIDQLEPSGEADLLADYAYQVPVRVICEMLGVPADDYAMFHEWVVDVVARFDIANVGSKTLVRKADNATVALTRYLLKLADERRNEPRDDWLSKLVAIADEGDRLDEDELVSVVVLLLGAGHETTANLIGNAVWHLHRNPEQLSLWKDAPEIRRNAVEELLRYDSPIQMVQRIALEDLEIGGVPIPKGRMIIPLLGAANRDPKRFTDPNRLDLGRADCRPVSFGFGVHHCIGAALARAEGEIAIAVLYDRFPGLRPTVDRPEWRPSIIFRGLKALPVRWD
jgi:cytochrome P450